MRFSLRALRYVVETADAGSVTEAAKRLNVSQPSISAALSQMEAELGVQIFVRHLAKGVTLSAAGQRLVNDARLLLAHARDFAHSAQSLGSTLHGEIVVGSFMTLATRFMPGLLSGFRARQPGISVKLEEGDQQEIIDALISGRTELALSYSFAVPDEIVGEKFCELPSFRTRSFELIRGLIGHGQGYSIQNAVPCTTIGYDGSRVAVVPITETLPPTRVMALRLKRHALRPAVQTFADYAREAFAIGGQFAPGSIAPPRVDAA
ncbi:MAG: LysR family transcriptional regulator [Bradyrhizobiaceae bacterium]|nr:MAG: LysR family transcriptional regulator [Bradyrhizobiaceae bacterium]